MRDRYYRVTSPSDVPPKAVLVHVYRRLGQVLARVEGDDEEDEAQPDLILFRAALERLRQNLVGTFVFIEDSAIWQSGWGDLVDYRGGPPLGAFAPPTKAQHRVIPAKAGISVLETDFSNANSRFRGNDPAFVEGSCLSDAWDYTLNLNSITSPSLTT